MYPLSGCLRLYSLGMSQPPHSRSAPTRFGSRNASYKNLFIQLYKYYTSYEGMEEMYREQKEGRLLHSQLLLRPYST